MFCVRPRPAGPGRWNRVLPARPAADGPQGWDAVRVTIAPICPAHERSGRDGAVVGPRRPMARTHPQRSSRPRAHTDRFPAAAFAGGGPFKRFVDRNLRLLLAPGNVRIAMPAKAERATGVSMSSSAPPRPHQSDATTGAGRRRFAEAQGHDPQTRSTSHAATTSSLAALRGSRRP